jgi:small GTP-binding protein
MAQQSANTIVDITFHPSWQPRQSATIKVSRDQLTLENLIKLGNESLSIKNGKSLYLANGKLCEPKYLQNIISNMNNYNINNNDNIHLYLSDNTILNESDINNSNNDSIIHLCMLGAGAVGKSALTLHYIQGQFISDYDPTIEDAYRKPIDIDGSNNLMLDILDTAGQEDFVALRTTWMRNKHGFILVYSVVDHSTFTDLNYFYEQLNDVYDGNIPPIILVGNKVDLDPNFKYYNESITGNGDLNYKREVSIKEALNILVKWKSCISYIETSAKIGYKVNDIFGTLVRDIISNKIELQMLINDKLNKKAGCCQIL